MRHLSDMTDSLKASCGSLTRPSVSSKSAKSIAVETESKTTVPEFLKFLDNSPSPYHAVKESKKLLRKAGYHELSEQSIWNVKPGDKFYITRNQSMLAAFHVGGNFKPGNGFSIVVAHTDSPCIRVKKRSDKTKHGSVQFGAELYGGGIWRSWFDRELKIAGRALVREADGKIKHKMVHIDQPVCSLPSLCIHLDNEKSFSPNREDEMDVLLGQVATMELNKTVFDEENTKENRGTSIQGKHPKLLEELLEQHLNTKAENILDMELSLV